MKHAAVLLARLAVYAAALFVVATARLPVASTGVTALRAQAPDAAIDPTRVVIVLVLLAGITLEVLRRRPVWH